MKSNPRQEQGNTGKTSKGLRAAALRAKDSIFELYAEAVSFVPVSRPPSIKKSLYSPRYDAFVRLLRATREAAGLSQKQAGKKLERTQSFISKCESGERRVDVVELGDFLHAYGQEPEAFLRKLWTGGKSAADGLMPR